MQPEILRFKVPPPDPSSLPLGPTLVALPSNNLAPSQVYEPLLIVGLDKFANVDIRVRVSGGGHTSQIYAIRQAIAKSIVAYYQKYVDEYAKNQLKQALVQYDRTLLVADNRRCEPKKFGGMFGNYGLFGGNVWTRANVLHRTWCACEIPEILPLVWAGRWCGCGGVLLSCIEFKISHIFMRYMGSSNLSRAGSVRRLILLLG